MSFNIESMSVGSLSLGRLGLSTVEKLTNNWKSITTEGEGVMTNCSLTRHIEGKFEIDSATNRVSFIGTERFESEKFKRDTILNCYEFNLRGRVRISSDLVLEGMIRIENNNFTCIGICRIHNIPTIREDGSLPPCSDLIALSSQEYR